MRALELPTEGTANVNTNHELHPAHIHPCVPGDTLSMSTITTPARVARPLAARAAEVLATLANVLSALTALVMIAHAGELMALAWVLLAAGALGVLAAQVGPAEDGRSVHDDEWGEGE